VVALRLGVVVLDGEVVVDDGLLLIVDEAEPEGPTVDCVLG
jgi:hypothetical protein